MTTPVFLGRSDGRHVLLKWHMLRRANDDTPFDMDNLRAGIGAGASVEIDIQAIADGEWVVLHDNMLDDETTGAGPVAALTAADVAGLSMRRGRTGEAAPVALLDQMTAEVSARSPTNGFILQLDLKTSRSGLTEAARARFDALLTPVAKHCVLSGSDWPAVQALGRDIPGLRLGFDPLDLFPEDWSAMPRTAGAMRALADRCLAVAPTADWIYLYHGLVLSALELGIDMIADAHALGQKVDVWTLDPGDDTKAAVDRLVGLGADQISTNTPDAWLAWWDGRSG